MKLEEPRALDLHDLLRARGSTLSTCSFSTSSWASKSRRSSREWPPSSSRSRPTAARPRRRSGSPCSARSCRQDFPRPSTRTDRTAAVAVVQANLVDQGSGPGRRPRACRSRALKANGHVAEADRAVARHARSARVTIPSGLVKSMIQAPGADSGVQTRSANSEHNRHRPHRLGEAPPAPGGLPDRSRTRSGTVSSERRASWPPNANLNEHEVGPLERRIEVVGDLEPPLEALPGKHPACEPAHDFTPLGIDVLEPELSDPELVALPRQAANELWGIGRAAADDSDLHPLTPVSVTPSTKARWARKNRMITGVMTTTVAAMVRFQSTSMERRGTARARSRASSCRRTQPCRGAARRSRWKQKRNEKRATAAIAGLASRRTTEVRMRSSPAAVHPGGVEVLLRDGEEELAEQEDREGVAEEVRNDEGPERSDEVELRPHDVNRHDRDLRWQHHRDQDDEERRRSPAPAQAGKGVRDRDAREQQSDRREASVDGRVERVAPEWGLVEDLGEVAPLERMRPEVGESACAFVMSEVSTMKANGARKITAAAIRRLLFATAIRTRRRRTVAGGLRRTSSDALSGRLALLVAISASPPGSAPSAAS